MSMSVGLSHNSKTTRPNVTEVCAVASSDGVAMRYVYFRFCSLRHVFT